MKSIMEEASSIFKAIEKGWTRAGKPSEFTVKVYEEPQHNFLGITVKSAKIGIFFNEAVPALKPRYPEKATAQKVYDKAKAVKQVKKSIEQHKRTVEDIVDKNLEKVALQKKGQKPSLSQKPAEEKHKAKIQNIPRENLPGQNLTGQSLPGQKDQPWSKEMVNQACTYLNDTLKILNLDTNYTTDASHLYLKFVFTNPIFQDLNRQKQFFASISTLMIQMLKKQYKRPLKGYKIILQTAQ